MKSFEQEYRKMLQEELPDFWSRIEAGIAEREKRLSGMADWRGMPPEKEGNTLCGQEEAEIRPREFSRRSSLLKKYSLLAVACLCMAVVVPVLYGGLADRLPGKGAASAETAAPMEIPASEEMPTSEEMPASEETSGISGSLEESAPAGREEAVEEGYMLSGPGEEIHGLADGTVIPGMEVRILEASQMKYHTVYRAEVRKGNDIFSAGEELEILAEEGQGEPLAEGEAYCVDLIYDSQWEIPFRLFENGR